MKKIFLSFIVLLISAKIMSSELAKDSMRDNIKKLNWNGIDVIYIEDNRFPTFDLVFYFADGALSEDDHSRGLSKHALDLLDSGTAKLSQKEILTKFDFYGSDFGVDVTHEYSTLSVSGLSKDLDATMTDVCTLFQEASFPKEVVKQELDKERLEYQSLVSHPEALSGRAFREISLKGTPYAYPVNGKLKDLDFYTPEVLRSKIDYFLTKVKKRIYLTGPVSILSVEKILVGKCKLEGHSNDFVRTVEYKKQKRKKTEIVFIPVPDANQARLQIGRFLNFDEIGNRNLDTLASEFLGGGFTSKLMREVRVKRGLTYSINSYISTQKQYGRSGITTFTKNETINKLIEVIDQTLLKIEKDGLSPEDLEKSKGAIIGSHPFKFENNRAFLAQLIHLDHIERPYAELFDFRANVSKYNATDINKRIKEIFGIHSQVIFVLGDKSLEKALRKLSPRFGRLTVLDYNSFI